MQPFDQSVHLAGNIPQVNRGTDDQRAGRKDAVDDRGQVILPEAFAPFGVFPLAGKARPASGIGKVEQIDVFCFSAEGLRAFLRLFHHHRRIQVFSGAAV